MNTYERDRAEGMLQRIDDAARRSEDYRRRAVSAGVKPQKAAARAKAMYGRAYDRMVSEQKELAERLSKLNRFLEKNWMSVRSDPDTSNVSYETYRYFQLLKRQREAMADYNQILLTRIGYAVQQGIED